ncbi:intradiol ring-cleavage dioxygenase [Geomonas sp. Red69]|uniref:Intradiol ring-cleavage dioxygenase n=1 Tax=Geomonas diazotrophica TaxID=2843197 RepID=A0ABX8JML1_9BACT|nr:MULTISPECIES: intradiol ring-cleavage dioxygenase [Geomonas]MBU5637234.1 intradiol ring-cleavage dioxygenase [Geomonas diazotrophica]QWV99528.1 intradiol ring-cleavage dioxygenase [Geomonas nitrogeniifigens]QXE88703.1 intradiol ring-cleavage dioxygenase [Geomonas nitrogeniifigens]
MSMPRQIVSLSLLLLLHAPSSSALAGSCTPTPWDEIGPFYRPNAPVRDTIGKGYRLSGTVRSSADCSPIPKARIEFWQAGPDGRYDDAYRATVYSDSKGRYRLQTFPAVPYANRPPHIHILVDVREFEGLVTQHYPKRGAKGAQVDLVLVPEGKDGGKSGGRGDELIRPGRGVR